MTGNGDKRLFLLDAMALIYRAYHAFGAMRKARGVGMVNSKGVETSAMLGFTNTLFDLIQRDEPTHIAVVFDTFAPTQRSESYDFYKANRDETPADIIKSIPYIKDIVKGFRIPVLELDGYEADDIIGTLAKRAEKDSYETYMVTPDKDFGQLVTEKIFIYKPPYQGKGGWEKIGPKEVIEKWDIEHQSQVIDVLGLMGDAVDNIPGVPGVGAKTAAKLLKEFGSIENLLDNVDQVKGKLQEKIRDNAEQARISKELATIDIDVPIDVDEEELVMEEPDREKLAELFNELEFRTLGKRILGEKFVVTQTEEGQMDLFGQSTSETKVELPEVSGEAKTIDNTDHKYTLVEGEEAIQNLVKDLQQAKTVCFDTETTGLDPLTAELIGVALSSEPHRGYYIPVPDDKDKAMALVALLQPLFDQDKPVKVAQNIKYDLLVLQRYGLEVKGELFDTMIAHYLMEPDLRHNMDFMAETYLGYHPVSIESLIGKKGKNLGSMRDVELEKVKEYAAEDADITLQLYQLFAPNLKEAEVEKLFTEVEMPLVPVLARMEREGVRIDKDFLTDFSKELESEVKALEQKIYEEAGTKFNIGSPKQLGDVLFKKMEIPYKGKKTKTGQYSTNEDVLSKIADEHAIAALVLEFREIGKLKSTYVDALPSLILEETGRVHTTYNQAVANTGRLSSQNPNLQNIPIRTERGRKVRQAFIPREEGYVIMAADYSQIELRIIAALSQDENMMTAFKNKEDIHTATAAKVFGVKPEEVDRNMRSQAKAVNFGIAYGQTAFGLSQTLNISRTEAKEIIDAYFEQFPGIKQHIDDSIAFAQKHGYAKTLLGRKRQLKDINASNNTVRGFAERNAVNMPIQGTAADMIKVAMIDIDREMQKKNYQSKMIMQVHDELVFDVYEPELDELREMVIKKMQHAVELDVPIEVEVGVGEHWLAAH